MKGIGWVILILVILGALFIFDNYMGTHYAPVAMAFLAHVVKCFIDFVKAVVKF